MIKHATEIVGLVFLIGLVGWACRGLWRTISNSENPSRLLLKWLATIGLCYGVVKAASIGPFGLMIGMVLGLILGIMWAPSIGGLAAKPFSSLYDGGSQEIEMRPLYSMAEAKRKRGDYSGALDEIRKQLERFPSDFTGFMMFAEIQAENLNDLSGARETIEGLVEQEGHLDKNTVYALNRLADWELKLGNDPRGARDVLERIIERLPDSEHAQLALQRIAHLDTDGSKASGNAQGEGRRFVVKNFETNIGLRQTSSEQSGSVEESGEIAARYVSHLAEHPNDYEAREKLAMIYADHYLRLDLAADQLEFLIAASHQPARQVVRWLNLLADFQIRLTSSTEDARETLNRIVDSFPNSASAEGARNRMARLNLEVRSRQKSQVIKLGSYEQNIGLKTGKPTE